MIFYYEMKRELQKFYELLHGRRMTLKHLAAELDTTHGHLSQVFSGKRGQRTRKYIIKLLTEAEIEALGWEPKAEGAGREALGPGPKPVALFQLEHSSTWNVFNGTNTQ